MGLQELGREHQTLQIIKSRQSERKWERDREATNCNNCNVKFSVSIRKVSDFELLLLVQPLLCSYIADILWGGSSEGFVND